MHRSRCRACSTRPRFQTAIPFRRTERLAFLRRKGIGQKPLVTHNHTSGFSFCSVRIVFDIYQEMCSPRPRRSPATRLPRDGFSNAFQTTGWWTSTPSPRSCTRFKNQTGSPSLSHMQNPTASPESLSEITVHSWRLTAP